jgi:hypothetical protein
VTPAPLPLQRIPGFESTAYAYLHGKLVWAGASAGTDHPRNAHWPWQPPSLFFDAQRLAVGARSCLRRVGALPPKGLLLWLAGRPLPFPLDHARTRFDAIRDALDCSELPAFAAAALRVLGLGHGLTPSGDDFVGGIFFALAHAPRDDWAADLPAVRARVREAARTSTNVISAALLDDLIDGASYACLHDLLAALHDDDRCAMARASERLLCVGASSGADMLAGLLLALTTTPDGPASVPT